MVRVWKGFKGWADCVPTRVSGTIIFAFTTPLSPGIIYILFYLYIVLFARRQVCASIMSASRVEISTRRHCSVSHFPKLIFRLCFSDVRGDLESDVGFKKKKKMGNLICDRINKALCVQKSQVLL